MKSIRTYNYEILNLEIDPVVCAHTDLSRATRNQLSIALRRIKKCSLQYLEQDEIQNILVAEGLDPERAYRVRLLLFRP